MIVDLLASPAVAGFSVSKIRGQGPVYQSGGKDHRGPLAKNGPKYLRWALIEAATHAARHPIYADRYRRTKTRLGRQRGPKVAQVDLARRLAEAIWHMLTTNKPFAPAGAAQSLAS